MSVLTTGMEGSVREKVLHVLSRKHILIVARVSCLPTSVLPPEELGHSSPERLLDSHSVLSCITAESKSTATGLSSCTLYTVRCGST